MEQRPPRPALDVERLAVVRRTFEPRYGHALSDEDCLEIADNLHRFIQVLTDIALEDGRLLPDDVREVLRGE